MRIFISRVNPFNINPFINGIFSLTFFNKWAILTYMTPSEKFNKPVIGYITTAPLETEVKSNLQMEKTVFPADTYEVIDVVPTKGGDKVYVCNQWYKSGVVQLVPDCLVALFTPKVA